jgi:Secretion system C-terminal sorting domain
MKTRMTSVLFLVILVSSVSAQTIAPDVINSAGGSYKKAYHIIDWSIGELALVNTMENSRYIITNGFIQPFTNDPNLADNNPVFGEEEIRILPNPTRDMLEVNFRTKHQGRVSMILVDVAGHILYTKEFTSNGYGHIEKVNMTAFRQGTYFLQINLNPIVGYTRKRGAYKITKLR